MTRRPIAGLMAVALVALPVACGDDDSGGGLGGSSDSTEADAVGEEPTGGDLVRWCELSNQLSDTTDLDDASDPAAIEAAYNGVEDRTDEYVDVAPDQIRDDAETVVASIRELRDLLEIHNWDLDEVGADPGFADVFTPEVNEAGTRLDEFQAANCS